MNLPDSIDELLSLEWVLGEPQMETMVKRCVLEPCFCHMFCRILQRWAERFLAQGKFEFVSVMGFREKWQKTMFAKEIWIELECKFLEWYSFQLVWVTNKKAFNITFFS